MIHNIIQLNIKIGSVCLEKLIHNLMALVDTRLVKVCMITFLPFLVGMVWTILFVPRSTHVKYKFYKLYGLLGLLSSIFFLLTFLDTLSNAVNNPFYMRSLVFWATQTMESALPGIVAAYGLGRFVVTLIFELNYPRHLKELDVELDLAFFVERWRMKTPSSPHIYLRRQKNRKSNSLA